MKIRKFIRKFIKDNPLCSEEDIVAAVDEAVGADILDANEPMDADIVATVDTTSEKVVLILGQWVATGKVSKTGNTHSWTA